MSVLFIKAIHAPFLIMYGFLWPLIEIPAQRTTSSSRNRKFHAEMQDYLPISRLYTKEGLAREDHVAPLITSQSEMILCPPSAGSTLVYCQRNISHKSAIIQTHMYSDLNSSGWNFGTISTPNLVCIQKLLHTDIQIVIHTAITTHKHLNSNTYRDTNSNTCRLSSKSFII